MEIQTQCRMIHRDDAARNREEERQMVSGRKAAKARLRAAGTGGREHRDKQRHTAKQKKMLQREKTSRHIAETENRKRQTDTDTKGREIAFFLWP